MFKLKKTVPLIAIVLVAVIAIGIWINFAPTQQPAQPTPQGSYSKVIIKAVNLDGKELIANVTVEGKDLKGETPYTLVLPYGVYTFVLKYQNLEVKKTIEVNQPTQEVIVQFNIRTPEIKVDLEITADELAAKIEKAIELKEKGKFEEAKEIEAWLLSLKNKVIRITGEVEMIYTFPDKKEAVIIFMKKAKFPAEKIVVWGEKNLILKAPWKKTMIFEEGSGPLPHPKEGDIATVIGKVIWIYPENRDLSITTGIGCYIDFVEIVKIY